MMPSLISSVSSRKVLRAAALALSLSLAGAFGSLQASAGAEEGARIEDPEVIRVVSQSMQGLSYGFWSENRERQQVLHSVRSDPDLSRAQRVRALRAAEVAFDAVHEALGSDLFGDQESVRRSLIELLGRRAGSRVADSVVLDEGPESLSLR